MKTKTDAEVIIDGKRYNLSGYESEEYLQKIASYLNGKHAELRAMDGYRGLSEDVKNVLMKINLADDYFQTKTKLSESLSEKESQEKEIFDLKHDIIEIKKASENKKDAYNAKLAELNASFNTVKNAANEEQKKTIRLETEKEGLNAKIAEYSAEIARLKEENAKQKEEIEMLRKRNGRK